MFTFYLLLKEKLELERVNEKDRITVERKICKKSLGTLIRIFIEIDFDGTSFS